MQIIILLHKLIYIGSKALTDMEHVGIFIVLVNIFFVAIGASEEIDWWDDCFFTGC